MADPKPLGKGERPPATLGEPPAPTCDQAGRFFALLVDMGYADALDRLHQSTEREVVGDRPTSLAEANGMAPETDENALDEPVVRFDLGEIFRQIGHHNAYGRLASIIWNIPEKQAGGIPIEAVRDALFPFAVVSWSVSNTLSDFVLDWA